MTDSNITSLPLYAIDYRTLSYASGPLLFVEGVHEVGYGEIVELRGTDGQVRRGQVLEVDQGRAVVQVFVGTRGLDLDMTEARFTGDVARLGVSLEMLGRTFDGSGQPIDGGPPLIPEFRLDLNGQPLNPWARDNPAEFIQTGISTLRTAEQVGRDSDELERSVGESVAALALAEALDGPEAVQSAALAAGGQVSLKVTVSNVMGVLTPVIEQKQLVRGPLERGYHLAGVSSRIEAAAEAFEAQLELIIELAASEMRLRRLAEEIGRTSRRVNALNNVLIPRLEVEHGYIQMVLEERERADLFRLKRVKLKLERGAENEPARSYAP